MKVTKTQAIARIPPRKLITGDSLEIHPNPDGMIVVRSTGSQVINPDNFIIINPSDIDAVYELLELVAEDCKTVDGVAK